MASPFSWPVSVPSSLRLPAPVNLGVRPWAFMMRVLYFDIDGALLDLYDQPKPALVAGGFQALLVSRRFEQLMCVRVGRHSPSGGVPGPTRTLGGEYPPVDRRAVSGPGVVSIPSGTRDGHRPPGPTDRPVGGLVLCGRQRRRVFHGGLWSGGIGCRVGQADLLSAP